MLVSNVFQKVVIFLDCCFLLKNPFRLSFKYFKLFCFSHDLFVFLLILLLKLFDVVVTLLDDLGVLIKVGSEVDKRLLDSLVFVSKLFLV